MSRVEMNREEKPPQNGHLVIGLIDLRVSCCRSSAADKNALEICQLRL